MMDILTTIADATRERVAHEKRMRPLASVRAAAEELCAHETPSEPLPFEAALAAPGLSFICEVKRASPSKGLIAPDFPYLQISQDYERAGASAISCLTEPQWFQGHDEYLREITASVHIPVLRKDFTIDEYMIYRAKELGAAAVLLIVSILDDAQLRAFHELAGELALSALVEAHSEAEIERALACGARIIGVNNRNLRDFSVNTETSGHLRDAVPEEVLFVSESGIASPADVEAARCMRADAVLVGEALMRAEDKAAQLAWLRGDQG